MRNRNKHRRKKSAARLPQERPPQPINTVRDDEVAVHKIPNADRHVDDVIRKYNDFSIIERD